MKSTSILKKVATLAIVLALVMSVAGMAMANGGGGNGKAKVHYNANGGNLGSIEQDKTYSVNVTNPEQTRGKISFTITSIVPTKTNNIFNGWKIGSTSYASGAQANNITVTRDRYWVGIFIFGHWEYTQWSTVNVDAQWTEITNAKSVYTLNYSITSSFDGQPDAPAQQTSDAPITPIAATPFEGYNFIGWTPDPIDWGTGTTVQEMDENEQPIMVTYYEATVTGEYTQMDIIRSEASMYSLVFKGYANGVLFWPADVVNSDTQPTLPGAPYLAGYEFLGWTPGALEWGNATESFIYRVVTPEEGDPFIEEIPVYTLSVQASFNQEIEIPLGAPQTGAFDWSGIAGALAVLSSLGVAFVARKKEK